MTELRSTVPGMISDDYKDRFRAEWQQTNIRYTKLKAYCDRIELAQVYGIGEEPKHDCPLAMLREQQRRMGMYLGILEMRAKVEGIDLPT